MNEDGDRQRGEGSRDATRGTGQAPNVKPKPDFKDSKQDQGKKEKPAKVRRSKSTDSERAGGDRGRRRDRERSTGGRRARGRSEESKRVRKEVGRKSEHPEDEMADTECCVCFCSYDNIFKTPKLLSCGHTFCLECLARINVSSPELKTLSCPVCREMTELPHGRDLPQLGNNLDIFRKLPQEMQRALSIRFKRSKGQLVLKNPPPSSPTKPTTLSLPKKKQDGSSTEGNDVNLSTLEQGIAPTTVVDVGRPPNRVRGRLRSWFRSDQCYYAVVASIITITVALMLVGIVAFVVMPNVAVHGRPPHHVNNHTTTTTARP